MKATIFFQCRLTVDEAKRLEHLSQILNCNKSDTIRYLLENADQIIPEEPEQLSIPGEPEQLSV